MVTSTETPRCVRYYETRKIRRMDKLRKALGMQDAGQWPNAVINKQMRVQFKCIVKNRQINAELCSSVLRLA